MSNKNILPQKSKSVTLATLTRPDIDSIAEEIKELLTEGEFTAHWELITTYHKAGKMIIEQFDNPYEAVKLISPKIGRSERTLYRAVQFVKKFPDIGALPEGKIITWNKIVTKYLPDNTEEPKEHFITCPQCGYKIAR